MTDPRYQPDVSGLAAELERQHGVKAVDVALDTARAHLRAAAWKHCTMWLQVVNRLSAAQATRPN